METERLILRHWRMEDAGRLFELAQEPSIGQAAGWPPHQSEEESRQVIRDVFQPVDAYAIVLKATGDIIGCIGAGADKDCPIKGDEVILGYWMGKDYQNRGYVTEAAEMLIKHTFEDTLVRGMWCGCYLDNAKSARVQEKLGFKFANYDIASNWGMKGDGRKVVNSYLPNRNFNVSQ